MTENEAPVWPEPDGTYKGLSVEPLYRAAPAAAANDRLLYDLLALVDALRLGRARERVIAAKEIERTEPWLISSPTVLATRLLGVSKGRPNLLPPELQNSYRQDL